MLALVSQWRNSGQTQKDFSSVHGIKVCTLGYWIRRSEDQDKQVGFKEILPQRPQSQQVEIIYPNGVKVVSDADLSLVSRLIHLY